MKLSGFIIWFLDSHEPDSEKWPDIRPDQIQLDILVHPKTNIVAFMRHRLCYIPYNWKVVIYFSFIPVRLVVSVVLFVADKTFIITAKSIFW